jgi:type I restriction enzyme S subunit
VSAPGYESYRESGIDWLGEIPSHWDVKPIKAVASYNDNVLTDTTSPDHEIDYIEISDVQAGVGIRGSTTYSFSDAPSRARRRVQHGDIIVSTVRTYLRAIAAVTAPADNMVVSTGFAVIRPTTINSSFIGYALLAEQTINQIIARSVGVSYPAINASDLVRIPVCVPPPAEQAAIAAFLDRETGKIDALVEAQTRLIDLLKEKRQAVISHAVTKGLDPAVPMKDSGVEWLGQVPAHWKTLRFSRHFKIGMGQTLLAEDLVGGGAIPVFSATEDDRYFGYIDSPNLTLTVGDLVIPARGNSIGHVKLVRGIATATQTTIYAKAADPSVTLPEYVFWFLKAHRKRLFPFTRTAIPQITTAEVGANPLLLPPISEQAEVARFARNADSRFAALMSEAERAIALLQERRAALISAAVTGKIDVRGLALEQVEAA